MRPITDQLRVLIVDAPAAVDRLACTSELAARLLERWPGAMIVFDQTTGGRQGWLYLPDLRWSGAARAAGGQGEQRQPAGQVAGEAHRADGVVGPRALFLAHSAGGSEGEQPGEPDGAVSRRGARGVRGRPLAGAGQSEDSCGDD